MTNSLSPTLKARGPAPTSSSVASGSARHMARSRLIASSLMTRFLASNQHRGSEFSEVGRVRQRVREQMFEPRHHPLRLRSALKIAGLLLFYSAIGIKFRSVSSH